MSQILISCGEIDICDCKVTQFIGNNTEYLCKKCAYSRNFPKRFDSERLILLIVSDRYGTKTTESFRFANSQSERILLLGEDCKTPKNLYYPSITGDFSQ